jgi:hypothetical protein
MSSIYSGSSHQSGPTCLPGGQYLNIIYSAERTCILGFSHICLGFLLLLEYSILVKGYIWRLIPPAATIISTLPLS